MNKKGQGGPRKPISLALGIAFLALGLIPLLNKFGIIGFELPTIPQMALYVLSVVGGVILLWDALAEGQGSFGIMQQVMFASYIVAVVVLAAGIIPLLNQFGVIGFALPGIVETILDGLFVAVGALLLLGGTQGY